MKPLVSSLLVFSMLAIFSYLAFADQLIDKERWGSVTSDNKKEIIAYLQPRLQQYVNEHPRLKGQGPLILVSIHPDPSKQTIWIDVDNNFKQKNISYYTDELKELTNDIQLKTADLLYGKLSMVSIGIKINGVDFENIFPDDFGGSTFENTEASDAAPKVTIQNERLFINPGHGKYFNGKTWVYQRPTPYAGTTAVYEDMVNPQFAAILGREIPARSESAVEIFYTRDIENSSIDPKSHLPWKDFASYY